MDDNGRVISFVFSGRLGNLFYEICSIFEYCKRYGISYDSIVLPKTFPKYNGQHFRFEPVLGKIFDANSILSLNESFEMFKNIESSFVDGEEWYRLFKRIGAEVVTKDKGNELADNVYFCRCPSCYNGKDKDVVKQVCVNYKEYGRLRERYDFSHSVAIHVRRGDLLSYPETHPWRKNVYTSQQINSIIEHEYFLDKSMRLFVFGEDPYWNKQNIDFDNVVFVDGNKPYEDLYLMSMCSKIISNPSSFNVAACRIKWVMEDDGQFH